MAAYIIDVSKALITSTVIRTATTTQAGWVRWYRRSDLVGARSGITDVLINAPVVRVFA